MKIVVTGATGFIGSATVLQLARQGHELTALVRRPGSASDLPCKSVRWDATKDDVFAPMAALRGADAVIHLAGESVAGSRWTPETKEALRASRVLGTRKLVEALSRLPDEERPKILLSASAIGYYGSRGDEPLSEDSAPGKDFLATLTQSWESGAVRAEQLGVRVVRLRIGLVLGQGGGALQKMPSVALGDGLHWMSWIHLDDVVRFLEFALARPEVRGAYNLSAPNPVRNREFTAALARARGVPVVVSAPKFLLEAVLGELSQALFASARVLPSRATEQGFTFSFTTLEQALVRIYPFDSALDQGFSVTQFIPRPVEEVFDYFSRAENLETITPPWLRFHIVGKSTPAIAENTLIDYRLKIHGVPARWQSKIERWQPNVEFVDSQTRGPYAKWHHTHRFESVSGGTLIHDDVIYRVPGGLVGKLVLSPLIRRDVSQIFNYRKKKIGEIFKS